MIALFADQNMRRRPRSPRPRSIWRLGNGVEGHVVVADHSQSHDLAGEKSARMYQLLRRNTLGNIVPC